MVDNGREKGVFEKIKFVGGQEFIGGEVDESEGDGPRPRKLKCEECGEAAEYIDIWPWPNCDFQGVRLICARCPDRGYAFEIKRYTHETMRDHIAQSKRCGERLIAIIDAMVTPLAVDDPDSRYW